MSMPSPAEASQLLLFLPLIGRSAWPNDAGPQGNKAKNLMIHDPNPCQCFSVLLCNHDGLLYVPHLHQRVDFRNVFVPRL